MGSGHLRKFKADSASELNPNLSVIAPRSMTSLHTFSPVMPQMPYKRSPPEYESFEQNAVIKDSNDSIFFRTDAVLPGIAAGRARASGRGLNLLTICSQWISWEVAKTS
jgi:hypothetical protein